MKYGAKDVLFLVAGIDMIVNKLQGLDVEVAATLEETTGLGDEWEEHTPTGDKAATLTQEGAFFDDATNRIHDAMSTPPGSPATAPRVMCVGLAGDVIGRSFHGFLGGFNRVYKILTNRKALQKADVEYQIDGQHDIGVILQPTAQQVLTWNTEATPVDGLAQTTLGGVAYLHVTEATSFTNFVGTVRDSPDDITYADLVSFADNVVAPFAERVTVAGNVERYLAFLGTLTGTPGTLTAFAGFKRNAA